MKVLVVDDEELARARITELLSGLSGVEIVGEAENGLAAVEMIERLRPDVAILDIQMPGMNGFEVIEALAHMPLVIFATAYDEYAIKAFEVNSVDYLLKPISKERLAEAVNRARSVIARKPVLDQELSRLATVVRSREVDRLPVLKGKKIVLINIDEIVWIGADDELVFVHTKTDRFLINSTMAELERRLSPGIFFRTHRSSIVNLNHVKEIVPWFGGKYKIVADDADKTELTLSRARARSLKDIMPW
ncbi:MAG: response regulator transcription factor [Candidatus Eisenbacteria bacterium]|nr:response regulator transcription factor [Candidatus Eisenbacteria bacterium]